ncbi:MAG: PIG-L deacetylase family protein [Actinomycetota bacterium]|nr:PIG-L deacetylase family protein [Actinomycetota bacterium]
MTILAVGAHPDDIEIGCAGMLLARAGAGEHIVMLVMTEGQRGPGGDREARGERLNPVRRGEQGAAAEALGAQLIWGGQMDCEIPVNHDTVDLVGAVIANVDPSLVLTHWGGDSHQDHRAVSAIVTAAARRHPNILYFGGASSTGFDPSVYVDITEYIDAKVAAIRLHASQVGASVMTDPEGLRSVARARGISARARYAEGFVPLRLTLPPA